MIQSVCDMRLLLVQTYLGRKEKPVFPLGLAYLAARCREHEVHVLDQNVEKDPWEALRARIASIKPEVIGFSLRNIDTTQFRDPYVYHPAFSRAVCLAKENAPEAAIILGGPGFSMFPEQLMKLFPQVDFGIYLEAEEILPSLLKDLKRTPPVRGVYYRTNGADSFSFSGAAGLPDFSLLPNPRRDLFDMDSYLGQADTIGIQSKRGCGVRCAYCSYPYLNGGKARSRSPQAVVAELQELVEKYGVRTVMFVDPVFNMPAEHAEEICREILRTGLRVTWSAWFNERYLSEELVRLAVKAGCCDFSFSPDGLCETSLRMLRKDITVADIRRVWRITRTVPEMNVSYNFFLNPPGQTITGFLRTLGFVIRAKLVLRKRLRGVLLGAVRVEPYTEIHRLAVKEGMLKADDDLWAQTSEELGHLFYGNAKTRYLDVLLRLYVYAWRLKACVTGAIKRVFKRRNDR